MSERSTRAITVALLLFNGLTMVPSAFFVVPALPREWIVCGPFTDYTVPAVALGAFGALSLIAAAAVVRMPTIGGLIAIAAGLATAAFEIVEVAVVGIAVLKFPGMFQSWLQPFYFALGLFIAALGYALSGLSGASSRRQPSW